MTVNSAKKSDAKPLQEDGIVLSPEILEQWATDLREHPIRGLKPEERKIYGNAVAHAVLQIPAFRSALALLRPFIDATSETAYTDRYARVGLSYWWLYGLKTDAERAAVILHESMHVLNNHFSRREEIKFLKLYPEMFNYAADFEINTVLERVPMLVLTAGIFPDRDPYSFPPRRTMEYYAECLQEMQREAEENCEVHGSKSKQNQGDQKDNEDSADTEEKKDSPVEESAEGNSEKDSEKDSSESSESGESEKGQDGQPEGESSEGESSDGAEGDGQSQGDDGEQAGTSTSDDASAGDKNDGSSSSSEGGANDAEGSAENGQAGNSAPKCTCGKDERKQGQGSGQGQGQGQGQGDGDAEGDGEGQGQGSGSGKSSGEGSKGPGQGPGKTWSCDSTTEEREQAADEAGIERASEVEQVIARKNTAARLAEQRQKENMKARGLGAGDSWLDAMLSFLQPPVVDWRKIFRRVIASSRDSISRGRSDYTYRRTSRRLQHPDFVFPGMTTYYPTVMLGIDTSGSMGNDDYLALLNEIETMLKEVARGKKPVTAFAVDTRIGNIQPVSSVKKIKLYGGGGTQMAVAWKHVKTLTSKERPDIFVLATDGYIDWHDVEAEVKTSDFKSVILVTQKGGFEACPESLRKLIPVIDISPKEK